MKTAPLIPPVIVTDFTSTAFHRNLYEHYATYRRVTPVFKNDDGTIYLTRYLDCAALLSDKQFQRRVPGGGLNPFQKMQREPNPFEVMISHWMFFMDPPRHDVVRKAFSQPFTAKAIALLEPAIRSITDQLIDELHGNSNTELISSFAYPLPIFIICDILGIPAEDRPLFKEWSARLSTSLDAGSEESMRAGVPVSLAIHDYFSQFINSQRRKGNDNFFGHLLAATENQHLSIDELIYGCAFLIWSGHETTKSLIANSLISLCEHSSQMTLLRARPDLAESAVEEFLRYTSPVQKTSRWSIAATTIGGYEIPEETLVVALIGAANRDPEFFQNPDMLDITRSKNLHLSFSKGIHHCLGAALARLETKIAITSLVDAFPGIRVIDYQWRPNAALRGPEFLSVSLC